MEKCDGKTDGPKIIILPKLDRYILKKYFVTFIFTLLILLPIGVAIDISEKIGRFLEYPNLTAYEIIRDYYIPFIIQNTNTFMPLGVFISTILFTSKMASNTEIVAIHSAGISFKRFMRPYIVGAAIIGLISLLGNHFVVPNYNKAFEDFQEDYLRKSSKRKSSVNYASLQLSENDFVYFRSFNFKTNKGFDFSYEHFDGLELKRKIIGQSINWNEKDSTYTISNYTKRKIYADIDSIESGRKFDTIFNFYPKDLEYVNNLAKTMISPELSEVIDNSEKRGVKSLNIYKVEIYKRTSIPFSSVILTIIAVALAAKKRRGGIGVSLATGVALMFVYVFFMKVFEVLGSAATYNPLFMIWIPNIIFGLLAVYLYFYAKQLH